MRQPLCFLTRHLPLTCLSRFSCRSLALRRAAHICPLCEAACVAHSGLRRLVCCVRLLSWLRPPLPSTDHGNMLNPAHLNFSYFLCVVALAMRPLLFRSSPGPKVGDWVCSVSHLLCFVFAFSFLFCVLSRSLSFSLLTKASHVRTSEG